ncbi:TVP38/TMEM64 family protein [Methylobacterium sp. J-076]|uniref:TVP38/TMEM64 family protein n=1 Tax=Methylobacterium sp. J-076 TaxID=2836655 RepID=UPI001FBA9CE9|nr:VTT domain-containing protein [Methylobacterium sp. J-076]MCJ2011381.1 VTT domain-containing protein [Methylobacterium sp. J-076]
MSTGRGQESRWRRVRRWLPFVLLVGLSVTVLVSGAAHLLSLDRLLASRAWLKAFVEAGPLRALVAAYLVYLGAVIVSVPATLILTMICGFLFGIVPGALLAVCAATTGGALVFAIGRGPGRDLLQRFGGPRLERLAAAFRRDAFGYIATFRVLPLFPFWMTNLAPAACGVRMRTFVAATFLGLLPGAFVYATTGAGIEDVVAAHEAARAACRAGGGLACDDALSPSAFVTGKMVLGLGLLGAFGLVSLVLSRRLRARG